MAALTTALDRQIVEQARSFTKPVDVVNLDVSGTMTMGTTSHSVVPLLKISTVITHATLDAAATTQEIALTGCPTNVFPVAAYVEITTAMSGGTVSAVTVSVGDTAAATEVMAAVSVFTGASGKVQGTPGANSGLFKIEAAYAPIAKFTSTTANLADLTAGSITVHLLYAPL